MHTVFNPVCLRSRFSWNVMWWRAGGRATVCVRRQRLLFQYVHLDISVFSFLWLQTLPIVCHERPELRAKSLQIVLTRRILSRYLWLHMKGMLNEPQWPGCLLAHSARESNSTQVAFHSPLQKCSQATLNWKKVVCPLTRLDGLRQLHY